MVERAQVGGGWNYKDTFLVQSQLLVLQNKCSSNKCTHLPFERDSLDLCISSVQNLKHNTCVSDEQCGNHKVGGKCS